MRTLAAPAPAVPVDLDQGDPHKYIIAFAVVLAALMQVIDSSIVNVALPDMMGNLGASLDEIAWVSTGYILASVIVIPLTFCTTVSKPRREAHGPTWLKAHIET